MKRAWLCFTIALSGCATVCQEQDIYRPTIAASSAIAASVEQTTVQLDLHEASLMLGECGWAKRNTALDPVALCMTVRVEDRHVFQFASGVVTVTTAQRSTRIELNKITYSIFSEIKSDGTREPDSDTAPPTTEPIEARRGAQFGTGQTDFYSFSAKAAFRGAKTTFAPPMARLFSANERRRPYEAHIELPPTLGRVFSVTLPKVLLDGRQYELPTVDFEYAREDVCHLAV